MIPHQLLKSSRVVFNPLEVGRNTGGYVGQFQLALAIETVGYNSHQGSGAIVQDHRTSRVAATWQTLLGIDADEAVVYDLLAFAAQLLVPLPLALLVRDDGCPDVLEHLAGQLLGGQTPTRNDGFATCVCFLGTGQLCGLDILVKCKLLGQFDQGYIVCHGLTVELLVDDGVAPVDHDFFIIKGFHLSHVDQYFPAK